MKFFINKEGFYLVEAVLAMALFALVSSVLFFGWQHLAETKTEELMLSYALDVAHNELERFYTLGIDQGEAKRDVEMGGYDYQVSWFVQNGGAWERGMVEIQWRLPSGKSQNVQFVLYRHKMDSP
jgi:type II secretory pathway pseudopilin PulG